MHKSYIFLELVKIEHNNSELNNLHPATIEKLKICITSVIPFILFHGADTYQSISASIPFSDLIFLR